MKERLAKFAHDHPWLVIFVLLFILPVIASHLWWEAGGGRIPGGVYSSDNPELYNEIVRKELAEQYRRNQL